MSLFSRELEKRIRQLHRAELKRSPELLREFKQQRKNQGDGKRRILRHALMPFFWSCLFLAMVQKENDIRWAAGVIALWAAGTAFKWAHQWFQQFYASEDLVVLNLLPLDDRQIFRFQLRRYLAGALWIAWELLLVYLALGFIQGGAAPPFYALPLAGLAQTLLVLALALHCASYLHMLPLGTLAALFRMTAVLVLVLGLQGIDFTRHLVQASEWFLPTGWINYMLLQSGRDSAILALSLPLAAIVYLARHSFRRLQSFYSLEGLEIVPAAGQGAPHDHEELGPGSFGHRPGPTEIEDRINARHFLAGVNWELSGAVEKFAARFLSPRERVITEFLVATVPGWTRSLKWSFWVWMAACVVVLVFGHFGGTIVFFTAYLLAAASLPLFGGDWRGMRQSASGGVLIPGYALYPISFTQIARIFLKVNLIRITAAAPLIVSFAGLAAYKLGHPPALGALAGAKLAGVLLCVQPLLVLFPVSSTTNDTSRMLLVWLGVFGPIIAVMFAAVAGVFLSGSILGIAASYLILLLLAVLCFLLYRRAYQKGKFDLLNQRTRSEIG